MPPWAARFLDPIRTFYARLSQQQKLFLALAAALVLIGGAGFFVFATRPEYVVLYSNLTKTDSQAIGQQLDSMKIPYNFSEGGTAILVPRSQVDPVRLKLAQEGLPTSNGVGLEFLNKPNLYDTDETIRLKYLRAQEIELERTISQIQGIVWARVHLVLPKSSVFIEKEEKPTAAVELQLSPDTRLSSEQVRAIVSLVAHSVEGLLPGNVSVIDTDGNLLSSMVSQEASPEKLTMSQLQIQQSFEKNLQSQLQRLLDNTLGLTADGFHKAYVQVAAQLDFSSKIIDQTTFTPQANGKGIPRSQQDTNEYLKGQKPLVGGVPGTTSNIPGYPATSPAPVNYTKEQHTINYEITTKKEHTKPPVGVDIKQLNVAVAVDSTTIPKESYPEIKNLISSAAGITLSRGDSLDVEPIPFDESYRKKLNEQARHEQTTERLQYDLTHTIFPALVLILVVGAIAFGFRRKYKKLEEAGFIPAPSMAPPPIPPEFLTPPPPPAIEEEKVERKRMIEMMKQKGEEKTILKEEVEEFVVTNPAVAAELIRSWLTEVETVPPSKGEE